MNARSIVRELVQSVVGESPAMDVKAASVAAGKAGRRNAIKHGRPPFPWTQDDLDVAHAEFHRLCRKHKIGPYGKEGVLPHSTK
jgi:hypothetical protein